MKAPEICDGALVDGCTVNIRRDKKHFYDAKLINGGWGIFCNECFDRLCIGLGPGKGQKYDSFTGLKLEG